MAVDTILSAMRADMIPTGTSGRWSVVKRVIDEQVSRTMTRLKRRGVPNVDECPPGSYTMLHCLTEATLNDDHGETVMNDFPRELKKHLQFILRASGRVLVTGLGLGCVVRGLLAAGRADHIDVVERSSDVLRLCGASVEDSRVTVHHADAMTDLPEGKWDMAWHDIWSDPDKEEPGLQALHGRLIRRLIVEDRVKVQGAWAFPRRYLRFMRRGGLFSEAYWRKQA